EPTIWPPQALDGRDHHLLTCPPGASRRFGDRAGTAMADEAHERAGPKRRRFTTRQVITGVIVVVALLFIFQNTERAKFKFLWFDLTAPVWVWLLVVFVAGVGTGLLIARRRRARRIARARA